MVQQWVRRRYVFFFFFVGWQGKQAGVQADKCISSQTKPKTQKSFSCVRNNRPRCVCFVQIFVSFCMFRPIKLRMDTNGKICVRRTSNNIEWTQIFIHYYQNTCNQFINLFLCTFLCICIVNARRYYYVYDSLFLKVGTVVIVIVAAACLMESYRKVGLTNYNYIQCLVCVRLCVWETVYKFIHIKWNANRFTIVHMHVQRSFVIRMWMKIDPKIN